MSACSRPACGRTASATLHYDYGAGVAMLTDLSAPHPMQYDLCSIHADRLSVPRGWTLDDRRVGTVVAIDRRAG